jgi:hypothetical protein
MDDELLTIKEASIITGVSESTIYRYIRQGKLTCQSLTINRKKIAKVIKSELIKVLSIPESHCQSLPITDNQPANHYQSVTITDSQLTKDNLKDTFREFLEEQKTELMKPLEQQALYKLGAVEKENLYLCERLETLRQENELLREQVKALPDKTYMEKIQAENQEKEKDLMIQIELERQEKADLLSRGETIRKEQEEKHRIELEEQQKNMEELHRQELEQVRKQAEEEQKTIVEAWKNKVEELQKPWYKRLFS